MWTPSARAASQAAFVRLQHQALFLRWKLFLSAASCSVPWSPVNLGLSQVAAVLQIWDNSSTTWLQQLSMQKTQCRAHCSVFHYVHHYPIHGQKLPATSDAPKFSLHFGSCFGHASSPKNPWRWDLTDLPTPITSSFLGLLAPLSATEPFDQLRILQGVALSSCI